jgi:hypothetical protein
VGVARGAARWPVPCPPSLPLPARPFGRPVRRRTWQQGVLGAGCHGADLLKARGSEGAPRGNLHGGAQRNVVGEPARERSRRCGPAKRNRRWRKIPARRCMMWGRGDAGCFGSGRMGAVETGCAGGEFPAGGKTWWCGCGERCLK